MHIESARPHDHLRFLKSRTPRLTGAFLSGSAEVGIGDVCPCWSMASQGVEDERSGRREDGVCPANGEQRADSAALLTLASDLEREFQGRLENLRVRIG